MNCHLCEFFFLSLTLTSSVQRTFAQCTSITTVVVHVKLGDEKENIVEKSLNLFLFSKVNV